jgi:D-arabinose 1-dehydrogenase-like Zn-dependent alcohol dehydrogenase
MSENVLVSLCSQICAVSISVCRAESACRSDGMIGTCEECFAGQHQYCASKKINGFMDIFGGFSEYSLAHPASTVRLPDTLDFEVLVFRRI